MKRNGKEKWKRLRAVPGKIAVFFVLICIGFVYLEPILEMIAKAMMSAADIVDPSVTWIPKSMSFDNLRVAAQVLKLEVTLKNSVLFSGGLALAQTVVSAMTAYALSRYDFKGKRIWFLMIILTFIMPVPVLMVPRLMMLVTAQTATGVQLGAYDTSDIYGLIKAATNNTASGLGYAATYAWLYGVMVLLVIGAAFLIFREKKVKEVVL